jgi:siroheme synthase-like protein
LSEAPKYYPAFISLTGRDCLVIGGGTVAQRKIETLLECQARVRVISPQVVSRVAELAAAGSIELVDRGYAEGDLDGAFLVVSATNDAAVNQQVSLEAARRGQLINVVDDPDHSNFIVPATLNRGDITIAVSTAGTSPALARRIKHDIEESIGAEYADVAKLVGEVRRNLLDRGISVSPEKWQAALDLEELTGLVRNGRGQQAAEKLLTKLVED